MWAKHSSPVMMRRAKRAAIFASPFVAVGLWAGYVLKERRKAPAEVRFSIGSADDVLTEQLKTGDVLLFSRRWTQMLARRKELSSEACLSPAGAALSVMKRSVFDSRFDHAGVVVADRFGTPHVAEVTCTGIKLRRFDERILRSKCETNVRTKHRTARCCSRRPFLSNSRKVQRDHVDPRQLQVQRGDSSQGGTSREGAHVQRADREHALDRPPRCPKAQDHQARGVGQAPQVRHGAPDHRQDRSREPRRPACDVVPGHRGSGGRGGSGGVEVPPRHNAQRLGELRGASQGGGQLWRAPHRSC
ncbi:unnamed protein product [Ectocarpus sp. 4 AP-2014]